jgi:excinuclease ABC subunit C
VYRFRDDSGRVIYVGKASSLRARLSSYFADLATLHPRTRTMVTTATSVDWVMVANEVEALALEYSWIKEYDPRFNVKYRDDKSYPYLAVTMKDEFPRALVVRGAKRQGVRYFGPYAHAWAIRETVELLTKAFPIRTCRDGVFKRAAQVGRPCLLGYIDRCSAPCVGAIDKAAYDRLVDDFCAFVNGQSDGYVRDLEGLMKDASERLDYEDAARLRDRISALTRVLEKNTVVFDDSTDADVIATAEDELQMGVQVFHVRKGRIRGERGFVIEKAEDLTPAGYLERVLQRLYSDDASPAKEVLVPLLPDEVAAWTQWLSKSRGAKVDIRIPQRGDKRTLMQTAAANAAHVLALHTSRRSSDLTTRSVALNELQEYLGLAEVPLRIECIDISTLQGTDTVASLVVFEDGLPRKSDYRTFAIRTPGADDTAAMHEVVTRRFREQQTPVDDSEMEPTRRRFAYAPALLVVDGGAPQVRAAQDALMAAGMNDLPVVGLAKRLEEVWLPDELDPAILPRTSEALYLLQRIRDEAHRTAISFHRKRRGKRATTSALDAVPGLGPARAKALLAHFGSVRAIAGASVDDLCRVEGIGPALAATINAAIGKDGTDKGSPISNEQGDT